MQKEMHTATSHFLHKLLVFQQDKTLADTLLFQRIFQQIRLINKHFSAVQTFKISTKTPSLLEIRISIQQPLQDLHLTVAVWKMDRDLIQNVNGNRRVNSTSTDVAFQQRLKSRNFVLKLDRSSFSYYHVTVFVDVRIEPIVHNDIPRTIVIRKR